MQKCFLPFALLLFLSACRFAPSSDERVDPKKTYRLRLNPEAGSRYHYEISNESKTTIEIEEDKKLQTKNISTLGIFYDVDKDSSGNILLKMSFDKIKLSMDNGEKQTDMDADNAGSSSDPMEKMLGVLKSANVRVVLNPAGETKSISGYKEVGEQLVSMTTSTDENAKQAVAKQWEQVVGNGLIKNNVSQFFKMFPDSALRIGDKWKIRSTQSTDLSLNTTTQFHLKDITNGMAEIESEGQIESDPTPTFLNGYQVVAHVKGTQSGYYEMDTRTGMLVSSTLISKAEGTMEVMGRKVPIKMEVSVTMNGNKIK